MAIKKYTNFEQINNKVENEGKYLQPKDLFIVSKNEVEISEFGESGYDVIEVSVYDVNNNLLPQKDSKTVAYIKSGDIKNYVYNITNKTGQKEIAINAERLLNDLGYQNGIFKVNINFVRNRVGSDNQLTRVWIQQISATREEIRIVPLKTNNEFLNTITKNEFFHLINQTKDFKYVKKHILDSLDDFDKTHLVKINDLFINKFGNDFFSIFKKDFGISSFDEFKKRIFENFKTSVNHYLNNRYYNIEQSNFGKKLPNPTFIDFERYDFAMISMEIEKILYKCVSGQIKSLKRRNLEYQTLPKEFSVVELKKQTEDNLSSFEIPITNRRDVYRPDLVEIKRAELPPASKPIEDPIEIIRPIDRPILPGPPYRPENPPIVEPDPIEPPVSSDPIEPIYREPEPPIPPIYEPQPPSGGGGSMGGGSPVIIRTPSNIGGGDFAGGGNFGGEDTISQLER